MSGWIKLHRKILDNPVVCKDAEHLAIWMYLLLNATHTNYDSMFKGNRITLMPGQLITGRKSISSTLKINESKVQRVLKLFENEQQIEQQASNQNRLITILNWGLYQNNEQQIEQQLNNERTTTEQQLNTNKNDKNVDNDEKVKEDIYILDENEKQFINILSKINNYPLDRKKDLEMYKSLEERYPTLNLVEAIEQWKIYKLDQPLKSKSNPRSQINTAFKKYVEWGKCLKKGGISIGQHRTSSQGASEETLRLERIAKEQGLIRADGTIEEPEEVDF